MTGCPPGCEHRSDPEWVDARQRYIEPPTGDRTVGAVLAAVDMYRREVRHHDREDPLS